MFKIVLLLVCLAQVSFQKELTKNAPSVRIDSRCPEHDGETPVYLAHDVNCWQFYVCSNQNVIELTCPPATYFNPNKNVCDAPGNVDCGTLHTTQNAPSPTVPSV